METDSFAAVALLDTKSGARAGAARRKARQDVESRIDRCLPRSVETRLGGHVVAHEVRIVQAIRLHVDLAQRIRKMKGSFELLVRQEPKR